MDSFPLQDKPKAFWIERIKAHAAADEIIKGTYWKNGKGCAIGCTVHSGKHSDYQALLGIPEELARLEDTIFEGLPNDLAMTWPLRFMEAVPENADLSLVWARFAVWMMIDPQHGVIRFADNDELRKVIGDVAALWQRVSDGIHIADIHSDFTSAESAAWAASAAESAASAESAAWAASAAAWAASAACAESAASAACAAWAAWAASAESAAWAAWAESAESAACATWAAWAESAESAAWAASAAESAAESAEKLLKLVREVAVR